ncbi:MAG TPA: corrinoid protein [Candidatus Hydrogenedens sp.]|nr:corrinoid protein [Candidatus Hydrogenedens sp.]HPP59533.1 corrinoid protein [Candidatus Hydrogenedens sp.]
MGNILEQIAMCVERGKVNKNSPYPPDMRGQDGAEELVQQALAQGIPAVKILNEGLMKGMSVIGKKFSLNEVFVPDVLMSARAMNAGMPFLKSAFERGEAKHKGIFIIGTVQGDLHDIGKNLVRMMMEGAGWKVIDLGVDTAPEKFLGALKENPGAVVGMSALLTTTMINMEKAVKVLKSEVPDVTIVVGGAPLTQDFCDKIGADAYSPDPQGCIEYLDAKLGLAC